MKRGELEKILKKNGCYPLKAGNRHDRWFSVKTESIIVIPRHYSKEIPSGTLNNILKQAGIQ
jgi:predicted RNA binding protein YcfA (HicA-like mRNA interferase family)